MKLFSKIATAFVGIAMAVGVGVAVSNNKEVASVDAATATIAANGGTTANYTVNGSSGIKAGSKSNTGTIKITVGSGATSLSFHVGAWKDKTTTIGLSATGVTFGTSSFNLTADSSFSGTATSATTENAESTFLCTTTLSGVTSETDIILTKTSGYNVFIVWKATYETGSASTMVVKDSSGSSSPFNMTYGPSGRLLYAYESDGETQITSGVTWTSSDSDVLVIDDDFADNHCWVKCGTKVGTATVTASKSGYSTVESTFNVSAGDVDSLAITGSMTKTQYKVNDNWDPTGFVVTATYDSGFVANVTSDAAWTYSPATVTSTSVTSVTATASFGGKSATSSAQSVTVTEGVTYDLTKIDGFSSWTNSYTAHTVTSTDVGASVAATMNFSITNKQGSGVGSTYPCIATKTESEVECLTFTLGDLTKKISSVDIVFVTRYTATYPSLYLHKGSGIATSALSTLTISGSAADEQTLSLDNLNDTVFTVGYNAHQTSANGAVGIKSISIGLVTPSPFGDVDHISVTTEPNTIYHVGEKFDATGMVVKAFDGADEATANFIDVTSEVKTQYRSGDYVFDDSNVPGGNMWIEYTDEDSQHFYTDLYLTVYASAEYELVTEEQTDWSGQYLIVGTNYASELVAMNAVLTNPDVPDGYKVVTETSSTIETGQELEWTIAKVSGGYSIQSKAGKYIGSLTSSSNGMLVSDSALVNTISYSTDAVQIAGTNGYKLKLYNDTDTSRFRYYSSGSVQLYKLKQSSRADEYAQTFLGAFTCDSTGENAPTFNIKEGETYWSWSLLATEYDTLTAVEKEEFRLGVPSQTGDNVAQAIARYDYVVAKYGYTNFMSRTVTPLRNIGQTAVDSNTTNTAIIVVTVIAVVSVSSIGVLLVLKRRKNHI